MEKIMIPRWFIIQKFAPAGCRLEPKPKFKPPMEERPVLVYPPISVYGTADKPAFDKSEYRFWAATLDDSRRLMIAECRACQSMFTSVYDRKKHIEEKGCTKRLVAAYKMLLRDRRCVMCDTVTTKTPWGVPICSPDCMTAWCEEVSQPVALTEALALVGDAL